MERQVYDQQTPWCRVLFEKIILPQVVEEFLAFCGTRRLIAAFAKARYFSLSSARSAQSTPPSHIIKIHFNITLAPTPRSSK